MGLVVDDFVGHDADNDDNVATAAKSRVDHCFMTELLDVRLIERPMCDERFDL